jgi:hypothetical protein
LYWSMMDGILSYNCGTSFSCTSFFTLNGP